MDTIAHGSSNVGQKRAQNEDRMLIDADIGLFVVADGMGGHDAGEVAASIAVETAARVVAESEELLHRVRELEASPTVLTDIGERALLEASREVHDKATSPEGKPGMGCTLTLLLIAGGKAALAHVGDTRCYLWRRGETHQLTTDHTMVTELLRLGAITADQVENHPYRSVLSRAIGTQRAVAVDSLMLDIVPGDRFLLCSDGLTGYVPETEWFDDRLGGEELDAIPDSLIDFANDAGGGDNITALLVAIEPDETERDTVPQISSAILGKFDALEKVFLFHGLTMARLTRVLEVCTIRSLEADELVIAQGADITGLSIVVSGQLSLDRDGAALLDLHVGQHVGSTALLRPRPARASLWSREPSEILVLEGEAFRRLVQHRPCLGVDLLDRLGSRLVQDLDDAFDTIAEGGALGSRGDRLGIL